MKNSLYIVCAKNYILTMQGSRVSIFAPHNKKCQFLMASSHNSGYFESKEGFQTVADSCHLRNLFSLMCFTHKIFHHSGQLKWLLAIAIS